MSDLEKHVKASGRRELVEEVADKIKEVGVEYIYYQFVSVTGRIMGKGVPASQKTFYSQLSQVFSYSGTLSYRPPGGTLLLRRLQT